MSNTPTTTHAQDVIISLRDEYKFPVNEQGCFDLGVIPAKVYAMIIQGKAMLVNIAEDGTATEVKTEED